MDKSFKVSSIAYHRNGITGEPFHVVQFSEAGADFFAVVFNAPNEDELSPFNPRVAVFSQDLAAKGDFAFGSNSWRGDQYADALYEAIGYWQNERAPSERPIRRRSRA